MISNDDEDSDSNENAPLGVAKLASLHSSVFEIPNQPLTSHGPVIQALQHIALRNKNDTDLTNDVRAINMSFGVPDYGHGGPPDANSQPSKESAWSPVAPDVQE